MRSTTTGIAGAAAALILLACGGEGSPDATVGLTAATGSTSATSTSDSSTGGGTGDETSAGSTGEIPDAGGGVVDPAQYGCHQEPPAGAAMPPPLPTYSGTCPPIVPGVNSIASSGSPRQFIFVGPQDIKPGEELPVFVLWHWIGGDASGFLGTAQVGQAADIYRFIAIIPEAKGDINFVWPYSPLESAARTDEEFRFFDDMVACVNEQYAVNESCISSVGVSAGALWTAQMAGGRGQYLSSIQSYSGGTGGSFVKPYKSSPHKMPAFVLWGGPSDTCGPVNFEETSKNFEQNLASDGHVVMECLHNCGHAVPPIEVPDTPTTFAPLWIFGLEHPYWLGDGESPYNAGLPDDIPDFCAMGAGNAAMRVGECGGSAC